jgi:hypothetical protein
MKMTEPKLLQPAGALARILPLTQWMAGTWKRVRAAFAQVTMPRVTKLERYAMAALVFWGPLYINNVTDALYLDVLALVLFGVRIIMSQHWLHIGKRLLLSGPYLGVPFGAAYLILGMTPWDMVMLTALIIQREPLLTF